MSSELSCESCTFLNARGTRICGACGRSLGLPSINLTNSGIECPRCTFSNSMDSVNCVVCEMTLVKTPKVNIVTVSTKSCLICYSNMMDVFEMPGCSHTVCKSCAKQHFTIKIMNYGINNIRCPIDVCSSFDELINKAEFFKDLKLSLQGILDDKTHKMFISKIAILDIMDKPGFLRCSQCNHGFITKLKTKLATCPDCLNSFCSKCCKLWSSGHSQVACKPNEYANENGEYLTYANAICPQCKYKYFLERGGCMHITCTQCSYEYCEFCFKKITGKGKNCNFPNCSKGQSLHGHHPRNCMYYVREMDHTKVEYLLQQNGIRYSLTQSCISTTCKVKVNESIGDNWVDSECKKPADESYNNMCLDHYKWHLGELMKKHDIDPVDAMNNLECNCELKRNNINIKQHSSYNQPIEDKHTVFLRSTVRLSIPFEKVSQQ